MADDLRESALDYHRHPRPGKLAIQATKPLTSQCIRAHRATTGKWGLPFLPI